MPTTATRQRVEGQLQRTLPAQLTIRELEPGQADDGLLRLRLSVSSEAPYLRSSWWDDPWIEVLGHAEGEIDLVRLNGRATVLANHNRYQSLGNTPLAGIGSVERAWIESDRLLCDIVISRRAALEDLRQDIKDGLVTLVSIGYVINERLLTKAGNDGQPNEYRVTSWTPFEVSLVDIPADASVGLGRDMPDPQDTPEARQAGPRYRVIDLPAPQPAAPTAPTQVSTEGERHMPTTATPAGTGTTDQQQPVQQRTADPAPTAVNVAAIREATRVAGFGTDVALDLIERGLNLDQAREELFRRMSEQSERAPTRSTGGDIYLVGDEQATRRELMAEAVAHRMMPTGRLSDGAREFRHMSLLRMAEESLALSGVRVRGLAPMEIASRALHTNSDFPLVLSAVANKRLRTAYEASPTTYQLWARRAPNAPDFKAINVVNLGGAPDLEQVGEGGEFKYGTVSEAGEVYKVFTYGKVLAFSRQAIVNDDLRGFDRMVTAFASSARRLENRLVYRQLVANPNMADGKALFHADHANLAAAGGAISATTLSAARAGMRKQKGLAGEELNITPSYLIVPSDLEQLAYQFTSSQYVPAKATDTNEFRAGGRTALEPIVDPVLDSYSTAAWYLAGDGMACDTVEYCWLDGAEGVYLESEPGFDVDGMKLKARLDFGAKAADHRGLYKNPGA